MDVSKERKHVMKFTSNEEIPVGSVLYGDFGWSMCIPKFYKVLSHKGKKSLVVEECEKDKVSGDGWQGQCVAGDPNGRTFVARITSKGFIHINDHYVGVWDGKPKCYDYLD